MNLDDLDALEQAVLASDLLEHILDRHRQTAHALLAEAAVEWLEEGCPRYDNREASCTAAVAGRLLTKIDERKSNALQPMVTLETGAWTEEHFSGEKDPTTVPRPDLVVWLGLQHEARMNVECKRLLSGFASPRDYVQDGVCRFLNGRYPVDEGVGAMIGFLLDRDPATAAHQIDDAIRAVIERDEPLHEDGPLATLESIYRSTHDSAVGDLELVHLLVDMTECGEPLHG